MYHKITPLLLIAILSLSLGIVSVFYLKTRPISQAPSTGIEIPFNDNQTLQSLRLGFDALDGLNQWVTHHFKKGARVRLISDETQAVMMDFLSQGDATLMLTKAPVAIEERPQLEWEWRVIEFPSGKKNKKFSDWSDTDYGARVHVVFEGLTDVTSETIVYIWDDHFAVGTSASLPLFSHIKLLVVQNAQAGTWQRESRDIFADYEMLFGKPPDKNVRAIGVMSDSDHTKSSTHAQYKNLSIKFLQPMTKDRTDHVEGQNNLTGWLTGIKTSWTKFGQNIWHAGRDTFKRLSFKRKLDQDIASESDRGDDSL